LHGSRSPTSRSFAANLAKDAFHCFVCGAGGNPLDLWAAARGLPLFAATCELCQRLGIEIPWLTPPNPTRTTPVSRRPPMRPQ
jgi:DNA primase